MSSAATDVTTLQPNARAPQARFERVLYGLPCAHCGTYYPSDFQQCPTCRSAERVPTVVQQKLR